MALLALLLVLIFVTGAVQRGRLLDQPLRREPTEDRGPQAKPPTRRRGARRKLAAVLALLALTVAGAVVGSIWATFNDTGPVTDNAFQTGTVALADNDTGTAMLGLTDAQPGSSDTSCIKVSYTGSLPATVRLYGTTTGTGLDQYLDLIVTRGTTLSSFDDCTTFLADVTEHLGAGQGAGVIYKGTLRDFADSFDAGLVDPTSASPETWTNPEDHAYKFVVSLQDNAMAQGLNATQAFTWETRSP